MRSIYLLSPRSLSPETIAVAFAKTSRSPESFQEIAAGLSDEKSAQFHEKWVVGYGHASVAEHAVLHIAFENVSRLAIEAIESNRLASYTEKSTRYQQWAPGGYYTPRVIGESRHAGLYRETCDGLFEAYLRSLDPVRALVQKKFPRKAGESADKWDGRVRSKYVDVCRFLLPMSALANVGMTANARVVENAIRKMLSHSLEEVREIGAEVKQVALGETPTLVKYAERVEYLEETESALETWGAGGRGQGAEKAVGAPSGRDEGGGDNGQRGNVGAPSRSDRGGRDTSHAVTLAAYDPDAEDRFLAACLYRFGECSLAEALEIVRQMDAAMREALANEALGRLGQHDTPLRELEHVTYTVDAVMDQGAYFEVKRHRMMTQTPQRLTARLGYAVPRAIDEAAYRSQYEAAMTAATEAYEALAAEHPHEAAYVVPNAFNRRVLMTLNLREVFHFCELRGAPGAHFSVRRIAGMLHEQVARVHPQLARFMRVTEHTPWRELEAEFFSVT